MAYADWTEIVETTILEKDKLSILEFGLGDGTKYLVDNFKKVYSYEIIDDADPTLVEWGRECVQKLSAYSNWEYEITKYSEIDFVDYDSNLSSKLLNRVDELFDKYKFEAVLVDGGYHVRGDIANYILNKFSTKYVVIHDTNFNYEVDGYGRINLPKNYSTVEYTEGEGTHIFIKS